MRHILLLPFPALALLLAAAACGGDGGSSQPREVTAEFSAAARQASEAAVLTIDDFPPGWTASPPEPGDESDLPLSPECQVFNRDEFPGQAAAADSDDFTGPEEQEASSGAAAFPAEEDAQGALDDFNDAISRCRDDLIGVFQDLFVEGYEEGGGDPALIEEMDFSLDRLSFTRLGDASSAHRLDAFVTAEGETARFTVDLIVVRRGRMLAGLFYLAFGEADIEEEEGLARIMSTKLAEAEQSLPD